jgi:hypothetical protein
LIAVLALELLYLERRHDAQAPCFRILLLWYVFGRGQHRARFFPGAAFPGWKKTIFALMLSSPTDEA